MGSNHQPCGQDRTGGVQLLLKNNMKPPLSISILLVSFLCPLSLSQEDITGCCKQIKLESSGLSGEHQSNRLGLFQVSGVFSDRPVYKLGLKDEFLFYLKSKGAGLWMVGPQVGQFNGGLANKGDAYCPENLTNSKWKYTDGTAWHAESKMITSCEDEIVDPDCEYMEGVEFVGGDLHEDFGGGGLATDDLSSAECLEECDKRVGCNYWSWVKGEKINCFLKKNKGDLVKSIEYISGSASSACDKTSIPTDQEKSGRKFNRNEINGKFKITNLKWSEKLKSKETQEFKDLAKTIEDSIESMLKNERELSEKVDFTVSVQNFKKGSVVCNFKVNYVIKDAWVAIPFAIKESDVVKAMDKNFKLKKGILFQRFLIAANSFNTSTPLDHCAAKGCSHKCNYDYDVELYVCTCPRNLVLGEDQLNCMNKEQSKDEADTNGVSENEKSDENDFDNSNPDNDTERPDSNESNPDKDEVSDNDSEATNKTDENYSDDSDPDEDKEVIGKPDENEYDESDSDEDKVSDNKNEVTEIPDKNDSDKLDPDNDGLSDNDIIDKENSDDNNKVTEIPDENDSDGSDSDEDEVSDNDIEVTEKIDEKDSDDTSPEKDVVSDNEKEVTEKTVENDSDETDPDSDDSVPDEDKEVIGKPDENEYDESDSDEDKVSDKNDSDKLDPDNDGLSDNDIIDKENPDESNSDDSNSDNDKVSDNDDEVTEKTDDNDSDKSNPNTDGGSDKDTKDTDKLNENDSDISDPDKDGVSDNDNKEKENTGETDSDDTDPDEDEVSDANSGDAEELDGNNLDESDPDEDGLLDDDSKDTIKPDENES